MTTPPGDSASPPQRPERLAVAPEPGSRLDALMTELGAAKAAAEVAEARLREVKAAIQGELLEATPEERRPLKAFEVRAHPQGAYDAWAMSWVEQWRLDSKRMKAEDPAAYVKYAVKNGHYELRRHCR